MRGGWPARLCPLEALVEPHHRVVGRPSDLFLGVLQQGGQLLFDADGGNLAQGTPFRLEINGTNGAIVVHGTGGPGGNSQMIPVRIEGATGAETTLRELPIPDRHIIGGLEQPAAAVAGLYQALWEDMRDGTHQVATFEDAVRRHRMLDVIVRGGVTLPTGRPPSG